VNLTRSREVRRPVGIPAPVRAPDHPSGLEKTNLSISPGNPYDGNNFIFQCPRLYRAVHEKNAALERATFTKARRKMSKYKYYHNASRFLMMFLQCHRTTLLNSPMLLFLASKLSRTP